MKSSWSSPEGGSSVAPHTEIEPCGAVFCAWYSTGSTPIRSFHTVSEGSFCEVRHDGVLRSSVQSWSNIYERPKLVEASGRLLSTVFFSSVGAGRMEDRKMKIGSIVVRCYEFDKML